LPAENERFSDCSDQQRKGQEAMPTVMEKDEAHKLIDRMPSDATWDDLMREIYIREAIERGLADSKTGRTKDVKEVRAKYGLPE
jgi:hypothetical protein